MAYEDKTEKNGSQKYFNVLRMSRGDLASALAEHSGKYPDPEALAESLTDEQMRQLVDKVRDAYLESTFWDDLAICFDEQYEQTIAPGDSSMEEKHQVKLIVEHAVQEKYGLTENDFSELPYSALEGMKYDMMQADLESAMGRDLLPEDHNDLYGLWYREVYSKQAVVQDSPEDDDGPRM